MLNRLCAMATIATLAGGVFALPAQAGEGPDADTVVATVDGTDITLGHIIVLRNGLPQQFSQLPVEVLYEGILDQLIQQVVLENNFKGEISRAGRLSLENERRAIIASEVLGRIGEGAVGDDAVEAAYRATYMDGPEQTEYKAAHILVETEEEARTLVDELSNGADFAALAREHSTGPSGPGGGDLGWFSPDLMVEEFSAAVVTMEAGDVSAPVQTQFGWHVIKLENTRTQDRPEIDDVRLELEEKLRQDAVAAFIANLSAKATIDRSAGDEIDAAVLNDITIND